MAITTPAADGLHGGDGRAFGIVFADAAGDGGGGSHGEPMAMAKTRTMTASVSPTAAMASAPRRATQKASTTPKVDSITISRMVGMASRAMPRVRLPSVKS